MARDPLKVLLRLRGLTLDTARRGLAERMAAEADAAAHADAIRDAMANETMTHIAQPAEARLPDAYAAWRRRMRPVQQAAADAVRRSAGASAEARSAVQEARVAVRTLEAMLEYQAAQRQAAAARAEQAALDEAGGTRKRPRDERQEDVPRQDRPGAHRPRRDELAADEPREEKPGNGWSG